MEQEFVTFEVHTPADGFERGWYYRNTSSLHNEPVGPFATEREAHDAAWWHDFVDNGCT